MLKRSMLCLMILMMMCRLAGMTGLLSPDGERLPTAIYVSAGIVVLLGALLIGRAILSSVRKKELCAFYIAQSLAVLFNLFYMKIFTFAEVHPLDFLAIGTLADVLVGAVMIVLTVRENRYIHIPVVSERQ